MQETWVRSLGWEDPLEKGTATHSSILAWRIPWTEEPDRLESMGLQRVRNDWATKTSLFTTYTILYYDNEFEQIPGDGEGQGHLVCYGPWGSQSQTRLGDWTTAMIIASSVYLAHTCQTLGYTPRSVLFNSKLGLLYTISPKKVPTAPKWETVTPPTQPPNLDQPQFLIGDTPQKGGWWMSWSSSPCRWDPISFNRSTASSSSLWTQQ